MATAADTTNLRHLIEHMRILNVSDEESTVSEERFPFQNSFKNNSYIVSDVDEELLLLVEFHDFVDLHTIKIHGLPWNDDENDSKSDTDLVDAEDVSLPKQIKILKIDDLSKDFNDIKDMKANYSSNLKPKKLSKGQVLNLKKKSKTAVAFKKVRYLALLIESNQNETEKTYFNGLILSGKCDAKLAYDIPYHTVSNKKKQKQTEVVAMFDTLDKKKVGLKGLLSGNRLQSASNDTMHSLLSYISRFPPTKANYSMLHKIFMNEDEFGVEWIRSTLQVRDKANKIRIECMNTTDVNPEKDYEEKMSYALMKILSDEDGGNDIKSFLNKKFELIVFHCMLMFHPLSEGNLYHAIDILKCLFKYYPFQMYEILTHKRLHYMVIQELFAYALISTIHHAKFDELLWLLMVYNERDKQRVAKLKAQWMDRLTESRFVHHVIEIAVRPEIYGVDIANKYGYVMVALLKQCAKTKETAALLQDKEQKNIFAFVVDKLLNGALDMEHNDKWYRIHCLSMVIQSVTDLSDTKVLDWKRGKVIGSAHNHLFGLFGDMFTVLKGHMPMVVNQILAKEAKDRGVRLGLYRLKGLQLLLLYLEIGSKHKISFGDLIKAMNLDVLCASLIEMALTFKNNNMFLVKFRKFVNILDTNGGEEWLKYMLVECDMMHRFIEHYKTNAVSSALKSFVVHILWDINSNCSKDKKWNFEEYVECNQDAKQFMKIVAKQIDLQKPTTV